MRVTLLQIRIGSVKDHAVTPSAKATIDFWKSGIGKSPVAGPVVVSTMGLVGDHQADLVNHGGKDKAIHCYPREHYTFWAAEFGERHRRRGPWVRISSWSEPRRMTCASVTRLKRVKSCSKSVSPANLAGNQLCFTGCRP